MPKKRKGKHPEKLLSAVRVRSLAEPGRYTDGNGLYLVVEPSGSKRWVLRTVVRGKRRDIGLGGLSLVSLSEAREEAAWMRKVARKNGDPLAERRKERVVVPTFEESARKVHAEYSKSFRNAKHSAQWLSSLVEYVFPMLGDRRIDQVESADVLKVLSPIWLTIPETADRIKQRIKAVFDWSKAAGFRSGDNPVEGITKVLPKQNRQQQHFAALPYVKVPAFIQSLREHEGASSRLAYEFLILTAVRTSEVIFAKWDEINLENTVWTIPGERGDEPGTKKKREHRVPLSAPAIEILNAAKKISDNRPYIFPGKHEGRPLSNMALHACMRRMKQSGFTPHGFRSSFRDWAAEKTNFPREVVEAALAHEKENKVEAAYFRSDLFEKRRKLMDAWSAFVTSRQANVVQIRA